MLNYVKQKTPWVYSFFPASCARMCMSPGYAMSSAWSGKRKEMEQLYFSISVQLDEIDFV